MFWGGGVVGFWWGFGGILCVLVIFGRFLVAFKWSFNGFLMGLG